MMKKFSYSFLPAKIASFSFVVFSFVVFSFETFSPATVSAQEPVATPTLVPGTFTALPLGTIRPEGWLLNQLKIQADGLTGHLDEFWPDLKISQWRGNREGENWERGPYFLDGLVPLAWELNDERLKEKAFSFLEPILQSAQPNGFFGPECSEDSCWCRSIALKVLRQYYEATHDERVLPVMQNYFHFLHEIRPEWPDATWQGMRGMEMVHTGIWLYQKTGDPVIFDVIQTIPRQCFDWGNYFANFPYTTVPISVENYETMHKTHVVNIAMALKNEALEYYLDGDAAHRNAAVNSLTVLDRYHGQAGGRFSGDELLSGKNPTQGTELCAIVEMMFSMENLIEAFGDVAFSDRLELLAYNGNPGACTPDYCAHQYDQQSNQVLVSVAKRNWSNNSDTSNIYGVEPHFGCCTANMHQGWPKFVSHLWMATPDSGLAATAYGPCRVEGTTADGKSFTIREITDYPFDGTIRFEIETESDAAFPLYLRIPAWGTGTTLNVGGTSSPEESHPAESNTYTKIERIWKTGDFVEMSIPMTIRTERRYNDSVTFYRGPLLLSLKIGQRYEKLKDWAPRFADWEITPTTPWNYGLSLRDGWEQDIQIQTQAPSAIPFDHDASPVTVRLKGRQIPDWKLEANSAGEIPQGVSSQEPEEWIELIPYGSTRLRITEFPVLCDQ